MKAFAAITLAVSFAALVSTRAQAQAQEDATKAFVQFGDFMIGNWTPDSAEEAKMYRRIVIAKWGDATLVGKIEDTVDGTTTLVEETKWVRHR